MRYAYSAGVFFLMMRRPPRSTLDRSSAASDVYKRQGEGAGEADPEDGVVLGVRLRDDGRVDVPRERPLRLSLIHISEPTRPY